MRHNRRLFALLATLMLCLSFLTVTASAEADPPANDVIIYTSDPTEPRPTEAPTKPTTPPRSHSTPGYGTACHYVTDPAHNTYACGTL